MAARKAKRTAKPRSKANGEKKATKKAFPLISRTDLKRLLDQTALLQNRISSVNGSLREMIGDYIKRKHLHAGAFRTINRWKRLGERDPQALWLELAHIDDMREKAGIDKLAKRQGDLLPPIADEGDDNVEQPTEPESENVVNYPREVEEQAGEAAA